MNNRFLKTNPSFQSIIMSGALIVASSGAFTTIAFADDDIEQSEARQERGEKRGPGKRMFEGLDLSEEQRAAVKELRQKNKSQMQALRKEHKAAREKLEEAQSNSNTSEGELKKLFDAAASKRRALEEARFNSMLDIRKILTPEQREKVKSKMKSRFGKGRRHEGRKGE